MDLKKVMYALIAVVVLLAGALAYVWWNKTTLVNELNVEKEELTSQMIALQNDYGEFCPPGPSPGNQGSDLRQ